MYKRIILKLSGEALFADNSYDNDLISKLACVLNKTLKAGVQIAIVVGGGNYWRGKNSAPHLNRSKSDQIGMMATVMNAIYISEMLRADGISTAIMTPFEIGSFTEQFTKDKAINYLSQNKIVIFAAGTGHPFFSTDTLVALRGAELEADALLFAKNGVDCIYDDDPRLNQNAKKLTHVTFEQILSDNKLKAIDSAAACICLETDIKAIVFGMDNIESIYSAAMGEEIGTLIYRETL